jgi:hypothetical protein
MWSKVLFILPKSVSGADDYTQLPVKFSFLLFGIEVIITMFFFSRAAMSFTSRHISHETVRKMSTGIFVFSSSLFWLSYSVTFLSFIFYTKAELVSVSNTSKPTREFAFDMYRMHKIWTDEWIDQPAFLLFYSSAMFVAFAIYIVSVRNLFSRVNALHAHVVQTASHLFSTCCFILNLSPFRTQFSLFLFGVFGCKFENCLTACVKTAGSSSNCFLKKFPS